MSLVNPTQVISGKEIESKDVNEPINQLANVINGNIDDANIKDGGISGGKVVLTPEQVKSQVLGPIIASDYGYIQGTGASWCRKTVAMPAGFTNSNCRVVVSSIGYKLGVPASIRDYNDLEMLTCARINSAANSVTITLARSTETIFTEWCCGYTLLYIKTA